MPLPMVVEILTPARKPESLPCRLFVGDPREGDPMEHASYSINGGLPDGNGGGVLFWCYSLENALAGARWCVENGYHRVNVSGWSQRGEDTGSIIRF